ncbi:MAG TPA: hypothetical protein VMJ35_00885 [Dongiaceae bacterium]|nr:hypothetical protein [Dongiaceae bacterium]
MAAIAVKFQNPRNDGSFLVAFSLLGLFARVSLHAVSQYGWNWSGEQFVHFLPAASICHMAVSWTPAGEWLGGLCPWFSLIGAAVKVLCGAL